MTQFSDAARRRLGDSASTRALMELLLAHRTLPTDAVLAGIAAALKGASVDTEVVVIEPRRVAETAGVVPVAPSGVLGRYERPKPVLDDYDTLLEANS